MSGLRFDDRVAVVTGGARGLGRAFVLELARRGAGVVVADAAGSGANALAEEIAGDGGMAHAVEVDLVTSAGPRAVVERALDAYGRLDIVVNNAGIAREAPFASDRDLELAMLDELFSVHVRAPIDLTTVAWPHLVAARGNVVNVVSNAALFGRPNMTGYAASKGALVGWTKALALEAAPLGVRVNALAPVALTRLTDGLLGDLADRLLPQRVAPAVAWLAHHECIEQGAVLSCVGGVLARVEIARLPLGVDDDMSVETMRSLGDRRTEWGAVSTPASAAAEVALVRAELERSADPQHTPGGPCDRSAT